MGVPKFFRWMSERYPAISQLIAENRIPEFDCLYLDMNGIIHNCTHKDSDSPTFRMTEDQMFIAIFNYIEHLFGKIKPQKLFFMAIDGVAPRAKMNQQRARRFRTALDAEVAREKAIKSGVEMPKEEAFDSNCITPGTEFMARLTRHLKYFISKKVSEDTDWQGVDIVLSGHEVPGEGEHKIMEYIRQAKAQPDYDPNVRHCLYGLDADLIMLGLLSHDPHFCLLREEVTFGRQGSKKSQELEHQNFYLMHLCIVREYLELEFQELKKEDALSFPFDMERVIDDFILMAFFVGNDFLPNLPNLHINEGALALMFKKYKEILPRLGGYINEKGVINLERLGGLLDELSEVEHRFFEAEYGDAKWMSAKTNGDQEARPQRKGKTVTVTPAQKTIFEQVKKYVINRPSGNAGEQTPLDLPSTLPAADRKFVEQLADDLHLQWKTVANEEGERHLQLSFPTPDDDEEEEEDDESSVAIMRIIKKYDKAKIEEVTAEDAKQAAQKKYDEKFTEWKDKYYTSKFEWGLDNEEEMRGLTENYVQGLQWVLYYYYRGVASWPWYYQYHYAPMISDVKKGLKVSMNFELGQPFRPYQQLMGVLPDRSKTIVPKVYHELMTSPDSPIIDFYPRDFELDMNGKKMEWEAVVKIPFIDEKRLLSAMAPKDPLLSEDEKARNDFGVSLKFTHSPHIDYVYPSSLVGVFPDIPHCQCIENIFDLPTMDGLEPYVGLVEGVKLGAAALAGFPSVKTLPHYGQLGFHGVTVFQQESRNESMIITLTDGVKQGNVEIAKAKLGKSVHVGYPFLQEAKVVRVSDELFDYYLPDGETNVVSVPHAPQQIEGFKKKANRIEAHYSKRLGVVIGEVESMIHVEMLKGLKKSDDGATTKEFANTAGVETDYATQLTVDSVISEDQRFIERAALPIEEEFPVETSAFFLGEFNYGRPFHVTGHSEGTVTGLIGFVKAKDPEFGRDIAGRAERLFPYTPSFAICRQLNLHPLVMAKIMSAFSVQLEGQRINLGLNLKFEAKKMKVLGYSRKSAQGWEYSQRAIELLQQYMIKFPEFIAGIQRKPQGDLFQATDFYDEKVAMIKIKQIQTWLKEIQSKNFEKVPLEAEQLDSDLVKMIEAEADRLVASQPGLEAKKIKGVRRAALLKPSDTEHRLGNQRFALGDRVVYAAKTGRVPLATRGTVVGMTRTTRTFLLDIVFDVSFMSGTTLGDRCSPFRGSTVAASTVLNVTDRQLLASTRAGTSNTAPKNITPLTVNGYGAPTGPNGVGQLTDAPAPPPLTGGWRGAAGGNASRGRGGGRGRGGNDFNLPIRQRGGGNHVNPNTIANGTPHQNGHNHSHTLPVQPRAGARTTGIAQRGGRGGYAKMDSGLPDPSVIQNNPNFKPVPYNQVPPPAALDAGRGGGRGRGGRGRGGRGRGAPRGAPAAQTS